MVGFGETYFAAFMLAYGHSELIAGLINTLPLVGGGILQMLTPRMLLLFQSHKRFVVSGVVLQGVFFLLIALLALIEGMPAWPAFAIATLYWGAGMAVGSTWNAWMHSLIPQSIRTGFFSKRLGFNSITTLLAMLFTGILLEFTRNSSKTHVLQIFAGMFCASALARLFSAYYLNRQSEAHYQQQLTPLDFRKVFKNLFHHSYGKVLLFVLVFRFGVHISAPFFHPYMLVKLQMSYWVYMTVMASSLIGRIFIMRFAKSLSRMLGDEKVLLVASLGISFIPLAWILMCNNFAAIFVIEFFSGILWGLFELALFLIVFNRVPTVEQPTLLSGFNLINNTIVVLGSLVGGACLAYFHSKAITWTTISNIVYSREYSYVFFLSTCVRLIPVALLLYVLISSFKRSGNIFGKVEEPCI
ncbi:MAG: MFS transporter [Oligoflexia bacterium]|nr:MFS transporter [Oligoflexia bacterium]